MTTAQLTSKGQITVPKLVRQTLGLDTGDRVEFLQTDQGFLLKPITSSIRELKGIVRKPKQPISVEEMNRAIAKMGKP